MHSRDKTFKPGEKKKIKDRFFFFAPAGKKINVA